MSTIFLSIILAALGGEFFQRHDYGAALFFGASALTYLALSLLGIS